MGSAEQFGFGRKEVTHSCVVLLGHLACLGELFRESLGTCRAELGQVWMPQEELSSGLLLLQKVLFCGLWFSACQSDGILCWWDLAHGGVPLNGL